MSNKKITMSGPDHITTNNILEMFEKKSITEILGEENVSTRITDDQLNEIIKTAKDNTPEEVLKMRESIINADQINDSIEGFEPEIRNISLDSSYEELLAGDNGELVETSASIFDVASGEYVSDEDVENRIREDSSAFGMSDEETVMFMSLISRYRKKEITNVFPELPQTLKNMIINLTQQQGLPFTEYNKIARMFIDEIIANAELDEVFVDFETSLNEALKIPSIADMYSEHTKMVMDEKIPEIIEKIKDTEPENAKLLEEVRERFYHAYNLDWIKQHYEENTRTRKLMRRDHEKVIRFCEEVNFKNQDSKFKMPDARSMGPALCSVFLDIANTQVDDRIDEMKINEEDLNKFAVLVCRSCMNLNGNDILDAAYMYYLMKNICMLNLTNENKTPFAAELINNICDIIEFIREKEAEFNASGLSKQSKKRKRK